jgi:DNA (cytosine-5)-methyltransferase 1
MLTIGSLFAGIGGFELGLERAGLGPTLWQAESNPFCLEVLAKHWPKAVRYDDVRLVDGNAKEVEIICGGFPCQDISLAGKGAGIEGKHSGLWLEFARVVRTLRPRFVVVENAAALTFRGLDAILGTLSTCGYHAVWDGIPAAAVGAPFRRDRCFVVASTERAAVEAMADPSRWRREIERVAQSAGFEGKHRSESDRCAPHRGVVRAAGTGWWASEPAVARVARGVPVGLDRRRLTAHGNAVVPQVAEVIGRVIAAL